MFAFHFISTQILLIHTIICNLKERVGTIFKIYFKIKCIMPSGCTSPTERHSCVNQHLEAVVDLKSQNVPNSASPSLVMHTVFDIRCDKVAERLLGSCVHKDVLLGLLTYLAFA